jgi:phenylalanyl-tRNA synthetase beta chain
MKYSLHWLGKYVDLGGISVEDIKKHLIRSVCELESFEHLGRGLERVCVARILTAEKIEGKKHLQLCSVDTGAGAPISVVCGAPNARAGLVTAFAPPGTVVGDREIKVASVGGVESAGMLCSATELGLFEDHSGILELDPGLAPGTLVSSFLPLLDTVIEVDNKSITHRPDLWGHVGLARELAAIFERKLVLPDVDVPEGAAEPPTVSIERPDLCPRYVALGVSGLAIAPAPFAVRALLHRCGVRPISNVVDATNFVLLELGQPTHSFDARELHGGRIVVRTASDGEKVTTLDGQERTLTSGDLCICDAGRPVALAGVMGLLNSEVRPDTTDVILEAATFRPDCVRRTAVRLGLRTEASARFEKSLDPLLPPFAARRFARLCLDWIPGARVSTKMADAWAKAPAPAPIRTTASYINQRLGTALPVAEVGRLLERLEFGVKADGDTLDVTVPSFRATKDIAIPEDLVEEVGRLHGYDNIPADQPRAPIPTPYRHPDRTFHRSIRTVLSFGAAATEIQSYSFDSEPLLERIGRSSQPRLGVRNPISSEQTHLRPALLPNVLASLEKSAPHAPRLRVYEIGRVFTPAAKRGDLPAQPYRLAIGVRLPPEADTATSQRAAYFELKGIVDLLSDRLGLGLVVARAGEGTPPWLNPARSAELRRPDGALVGHAGALHPRAAEALGIGMAAAAAELDLELLRDTAHPEARYVPTPRFPPVPFDLSVIVPEGVTHAELDARIRAAHPAWVKDVALTGVYRGAPIPEGQKSATYRILFQSPERTLAMDEVNDVVKSLVERMGKELGAWLRA